jgi:hypothetical protein
VNELENELPEGPTKAPKKRADANHLRQAREDLRGIVDDAPHPADEPDPPFVPSATPWIGDIWSHKTKGLPVDVVDVVGDTVSYENRGPRRTVNRLKLRAFLELYKPDYLVPVRPDTGRTR